MKRITITLFTLLFTTISFANIIINDITDFTFAHDSFTSLDIDFNNDGTAEFSFDEQGAGAVGANFDPTNINFYTLGTFETGGWDVIKALNNGDLIDTNSIFGAEGDAYINAFWANPADVFPEGESFVGVTFKLGANRHYGWMRVNSNAGVITLLSYAYNDVPDAAINAGSTTLSVNETAAKLDIKVFPNPTSSFVTINTTSNIEKAQLVNLSGKRINLNITNNKIDLRHIKQGIYLLQLAIDNKQHTKKLIIQ